MIDNGLLRVQLYNLEKAYRALKDLGEEVHSSLLLEMLVFKNLINDQKLNSIWHDLLLSDNAFRLVIDPVCLA